MLPQIAPQHKRVAHCYLNPELPAAILIPVLLAALDFR